MCDYFCTETEKRKKNSGIGVSLFCDFIFKKKESCKAYTKVLEYQWVKLWVSTFQTSPHVSNI